MTLVGCMGKVKKNFGVSLSMIARLKTRDILLLVGDHTLQAGTQEKPSTSILLNKFFTQKWKQFSRVVSVLEEPSVPILLWNASVTVPCTWA